MKAVWKSFIAHGLLILLVATFCQAAWAAVTINITESGGDVVATLEGSINLAATQGEEISSVAYNGFEPLRGGVAFTHDPTDVYGVNVGPPSYGAGFFGTWDSSSGDAFALFISRNLGVPTGYVSGEPLSASATKTGATLASLGMEPGTYVSTFSNGAETDGVYVLVGDFTYGTARFKVTKEFSDDSLDEVEVTLTCDTGLPLKQSFAIAGGDSDGVTFVLTNIPEGGANCSVTESGAPSGYTTVLNGGAGCTFNDVIAGLFECAITNNADPATFQVTKQWEIFNDEGGGDLSFDDDVTLTITCTNEITTAGAVQVGDDWVLSGQRGDEESLTATVLIPGQGGVTCTATEKFSQSGVEQSTNCVADTALTPGATKACTFTNTLFFEGIPTLSQYGMAVLVLLTLGLGLVGVRRVA